MVTEGNGETDSKAADVHVACLASMQHGLVTRQQALALGMSSAGVQRRVRNGRWVWARRGVYRLAGSHASEQQALLEACFAHGELAVVAEASAAAVWKLADVRTYPTPSIALPRRVKRRRRNASTERLIRVARFAPADVRRVDGIPVTSVARTFVDLARYLPADVLERSILDAVRRKLVTPVELAEAVARAARGPARQKLVEILGEAAWDKVLRSQAETRAYQLLRSAGLGDVVTNEPVEHEGVRIGEVDLQLPRHAFVLEIDGDSGHAFEAQAAVDRGKTHALIAAGKRVLRVPARMVLEAPERFLGRVRETLADPAPEPWPAEAFRRAWFTLWRPEVCDPRRRARSDHSRRAHRRILLRYGQAQTRNRRSGRAAAWPQTEQRLAS